MANTAAQSRSRRRPADSVTVRSINDDGELTSGVEEIACDLLAVSGGWSPLVHLHSQRQGKLRWDEDLAAFVPSTVVPNQQIIGSGPRQLRTRGLPRRGQLRRSRGSHRRRLQPENSDAVADPLVLSEPKASAPTRQLWLVPGQTGTPDDWHHHFVDFQRDQTVADVLRSTGAGMRSVEHIKRYTSISTANDQGKTSGVNAIGVIAAALRQAGEASRGIGDIGTTTYRAPFTPVAFAALAGRQRGELFDPARVTSIHPWHVAQGALFEDVGQWKRPWYYPQAGEDMDTAVLRECAAVRESVGFMDATTLGKIEIRGKDAGEFLNRIYTNAFKKLAPGSARYGVMCMAGRHDLRRRRDPAPGRGPVLHDHHHRRRRQGAGLAGGMAADRMARTGRALHLGDRTVDHHRRRRAQIPRGDRQGGARTSPRTAGWTRKPSRS